MPTRASMITVAAFSSLLVIVIVLGLTVSSGPLRGQGMALQREFIDPAGGFTQVVTVKDRGVKTVYVSGQVGRGEDFRGHMETAFQGIASRLESAGASVDDVVKIRVYATDFLPPEYPHIREVRLQTFNEGHWPTSTMLGIQSLFRESLRAEVEAVAVVPDPAAGAGSLEKEQIGPSNGFYMTISVKSGGLKTIYATGLTGKGDDLAAQTVSVYQALAQRLEAAGASLTDVVRLNTYIPDFNPARDLPAFREARLKVLTSDDLPASTLVGIQALAVDGPRIEVDAIAVVAAEGHPAPQKQFIDPAQGFTQVVTAKGSGAKTIYVSGQVGRPGDSLADQAAQAYGNLKKRLESAGTSPADLVKVIIYMANYTPGDADVLAAARAKHGFPQENLPASTLLGVTSLFSETALIEIEGIAVVEG